MALLTEARQGFHKYLADTGVLVIDQHGVASNADKDQRTSRDVALHIAQALGAPTVASKLGAQQVGKLFEEAVAWFLTLTFPLFATLRPGAWKIESIGGARGEYQLAEYEPYTHLDDLARAIEESPTLVSVLGNSYDISPDVLVVRKPEPDSVINRNADLVDSHSGTASIIRATNQSRAIVHAVASCKWTLRSDRAQNARSEALNIIRNRKGRTPHIAVITGEPTPSRLASLALGTGDLDMVYHIALPELIAAVESTNNDEAIAMLHHLVNGKRLRDIADLPLDLCV